MTGFGWIFIIALILFASVAGMISFVTFKYYWGVRGKPPIVGEERRRQKEEELRLRAKQIEHSRNNPRETRKPGFWDNTRNFRK